jgi:hypothetical protein
MLHWALMNQFPSIEAGNTALARYIAQGPSRPHDFMAVWFQDKLLDGLTASPAPHHHEAAGWVAVERAFVMAATSDSSVDAGAVLTLARGSFNRALAMYAEQPPLPEHANRPLFIKLGRAALSLYEAWLMNTPVSGTVFKQYYGTLAELGTEAIRRWAQNDDGVRRQSIIAFAADIAGQLAYNSRLLGEETVRAVAVPSTLRQRLSRAPGGAEQAYSKRNGSWDTGVLAYTKDGWQLTDKLHIRSSFDYSPAAKGLYASDFTDDITTVGYVPDICPPDLHVWLFDGLQVLVEGDDPDAPDNSAAIAAAMSARLHERIEIARAARGPLRLPEDHQYFRSRS